MKKEYPENSAIILSSTFGENQDYILSFLKHLSEICSLVKDRLSIVPVLVFEESENEKRISIQDKILSENLQVLPILLSNISGKGFASCLNYGIKKTNSKYIFRLDTDDRTNTERLIDQIEIMNSQNIDISCGYMEDQNKNILRYPSSLKAIAIMVAFGTNPIAHPTVCIKRESLYSLYDETLSRCEDFDLWLRFFLSRSLSFRVLKHPITKYDTSRSFQKDKENALTQIKIRVKYIRKLFIILIVLLLGLFPNLLRLVSVKNNFLFLRRNI